MDTEQRINALEQKIQDLEKWKTAREKQQISYPLDTQSISILQRDFMRILDTFTYEVVGAAAHMVSIYVGSQGDRNFELNPSTTKQYTVNVTDNTLTVSSGSFFDDSEVYLYTSDTYPAPFAVNTVYYVVSSAGPTFKLSLTVGGAAIDITTVGTGFQYITPSL